MADPIPRSPAYMPTSPGVQFRYVTDGDPDSLLPTDQFVVVRTVTSGSPPVSRVVNVLIKGDGGHATQVGKIVTQAAHGLEVYDIVRIVITTGVYVKAQADSPVNATVFGCVIEVLSEDQFVLGVGGILPCAPTTPGNGVWLSPADAGAVVYAAPVNPGEVERILGIVDETGENMVWLNYAGQNL